VSARAPESGSPADWWDLLESIHNSKGDTITFASPESSQSRHTRRFLWTRGDHTRRRSPLRIALRWRTGALKPYGLVLVPFTVRAVVESVDAGFNRLILPAIPLKRPMVDFVIPDIFFSSLRAHREIFSVVESSGCLRVQFWGDAGF